MEDESGSAAPLGAPQFVEVPLGGSRARGAAALVSLEDAERVLAHQWSVNGDGYAKTNVPVEGEYTKAGKVKQRTVLMARLVLGLEPGDPRETDHISRDKLDNRRSNLRVATHAQNMQNRVRTDGVSEHRGVTRRKGKVKRPWQAYGAVSGKQVHLGFYELETEAAAAASAWRAEHLPFSSDAARTVAGSSLSG